MESLSCIKWTILVTLKYPFKKAALPLFEIVVVVVFGVLPRHTFVPNNTTGFWVFFFQCCLNHQPLLLLYGNAILLLFQIRQIMKEAHAKLYTIASVSCNSHFHTIRWQQNSKEDASAIPLLAMAVLLIRTSRFLVTAIRTPTVTNYILQHKACQKSSPISMTILISFLKDSWRQEQTLAQRMTSLLCQRDEHLTIFFLL